jgi:hypothetical protein
MYSVRQGHRLSSTMNTPYGEAVLTMAKTAYARLVMPRLVSSFAEARRAVANRQE